MPPGPDPHGARGLRGGRASCLGRPGLPPPPRPSPAAPLLAAASLPCAGGGERGADGKPMSHGPTSPSGGRPPARGSSRAALEGTAAFPRFRHGGGRLRGCVCCGLSGSELPPVGPQAGALEKRFSLTRGSAGRRLCVTVGKFCLFTHLPCGFIAGYL